METCKICGKMVGGSWVDVRVGGVFRRLCQQCSKKEVPVMNAAAAGRYL